MLSLGTIIVLPFPSLILQLLLDVSFLLRLGYIANSKVQNDVLLICLPNKKAWFMGAFCSDFDETGSVR